MSILYYKKLNETYIELASDEDSILRELSDYFSFFVESARFQPSYRNHVWDGKIRLVNMRTKTTLVGLIPSILKFCAERNYEAVDQTEQHNKFVGDDLSNFDQWIESLNLPFAPRDYQLQMVRHALQCGRTLMLSSTGCHQRDTKIVMYDRSLKNVQDVQVGDVLLGADGTERNVLRLYRGSSAMYKITPLKSAPFVVNLDHVLVLWNSRNNQTVNMIVEDFINLDERAQQMYYLIRKRQKDNESFDNSEHFEPFTVQSEGYGDYYGFELDHDHLYFTDNWIVNHNSGKSLVVYLLIRWMIEHDRKSVIIVPSTSLVEQMHNDFKNYASNDGSFDVDKLVHKLYSKIKSTDPYKDQTVITTWQSICKYDDELFESWDCVLVDEAHGLKANTIDGILKKSINAKYRFGLTGTLTGMICHEYQITGLLGSIFQATTTKTLQDQGYLSQCKIYMVNLKYPADQCKELWKQTKELKKTYNDEVEFVNNHPKRQLFIRNLACSLKGTTLILFRFREHGKQLYQMIKDKVGDSRPVYHIDGKVDAAQREQIRQQLKDPSNNAILVFSVATSATGIDIKSIENLIINPSKSKVQTLQSIGRALRLCQGKTGAKIFDIVDDLRTGRRRNFLYNLAARRLEIYSEQSLDVEFASVQL